MEFSTRLILASGSPRRKRLLKQLGTPFEVQVSDVEEVFDPADAPSTIVQKLALQKGAAVAPRFPDSLVLSADTIVVLDGAILGKPTDEADAVDMLSRLSGRSHEVYTGIAFHHLDTQRVISDFEETRVTFAPLSEKEIAGYVASGSPMDKAGAYGIQDDRGALFVERVEGDYYNVVGLPLHRVYSTVKTHFADFLRT